MQSHAPADYHCPICLGIQGIENEHTYLRRADLVINDGTVSAFINSFWIAGNEGHVIIVPNQHYENLYDVPAEVGRQIFTMSQRMALAMKEAYQCDGITLRQNNEPAGDQHAFHYHLHVFPRYKDDNFNQQAVDGTYLSEPSDRIVFKDRLQAGLG